MSAVERFERRLAESGTCWIWQGSKDHSGYGRFKDGGKIIGAHRWSYRYHVGEIPDGLQLDHLCRVRECVNPYHLEPVTRRVNALRGLSVIARQAAQTHCKAGHEFTEENTYQHHRRRHCRACVAARVTAREVARDVWIRAEVLRIVADAPDWATAQSWLRRRADEIDREGARG